MEKVKILIVEDEMVISMNLVSILESLDYEVLEPAATFEEAQQLLINHKPDIALLDIELGEEKNGIDIAKLINEKYEIPFIFLTSNTDSFTISEAKETSPATYLVKPFNQDDLFTSIEIAVHNYRKSKSASNAPKVIEDSFFVKNKNMFYKVRFDEILFLKSDHVYIELHTIGQKKHLIRGSLTSFFERLPRNFYRTHRSYVVNLDFLEAINSVSVIIKGENVPIGKTFRAELMDRVHIE